MRQPLKFLKQLLLISKVSVNRKENTLNVSSEKAKLLTVAKAILLKIFRF